MNIFHSTIARTAAAFCFAAVLAIPLIAAVTKSFDRFRPVAAALEKYAIDHNGNYPPNRNTSGSLLLHLPHYLTTPVAYLEPHQLIDPFRPANAARREYGYFNTFDTYGHQTYLYEDYHEAHGDWAVWSVGPAVTQPPVQYPYNTPARPLIYDATNGAISAGVIFRSQRMLKETGTDEL